MQSLNHLQLKLEKEARRKEEDNEPDNRQLSLHHLNFEESPMFDAEKEILRLRNARLEKERFWLYTSLCVIALIILFTFISGTAKNYRNERLLPSIEVTLDLVTKAKRFCPVCQGVSANRTSRPMDCAEVLRNGYNKSGVYTIWPKSRVTSGKSLDVYCDMDTDGGGWIVLQRRGHFNRWNDYFFQDWANYKSGFGDIKKDFWLGNDNIFALTNQHLYSIRFDLKAEDGEKRHALYDSFWIDDESHKYTLHIKDYSGDAGDSMETHDNQKFSTKDQDNDISIYNCAVSYKGGWWYNHCYFANLNGLYLGGRDENHIDGIVWHSWRGYYESLDATEMKIRPKDFRRN